MWGAAFQVEGTASANPEGREQASVRGRGDRRGDDRKGDWGCFIQDLVGWGKDFASLAH